MRAQRLLISSISAGLASAAAGQTCGNPWSQWMGSPQPRGQSMAYDSARQKVVMFGGGLSNSTWEWDGSGAGMWTIRSTPGPSPREDVVLAYDSVRARTVMFGGRVGATSSGETWEWDGGASWILRSTTGPSARVNTVMAFDAARARTVLFGDNLDSNFGTYDTWEWDGQAWTFITVGSPRVSRATMTYDGSRAKIVLVGLEVTALGQTLDWGVWEWSGAAWLRTGTGGLPSGFSRPPWRAGWAVFDPVRGRTLLIGRSAHYFFPPIEFWQWDGAAWTLLQSSSAAPPHDCCLNYHTSAAYDGTGIVLVASLNSGGAQTWRLASGLDNGPAFTQVPLVSYQSVALGSTVVLAAQAGSPAAYRWSFNGVPLSDGGHISGAMTPTLTITPASGVDTGGYSVAATDSCGTTSYGPVALSVQCYPNCDGSFVPPILTGNDFVCFISWYANAGSCSGGCYPNCDGSTGQPVLTANDFLCFINSFAVGCT